VTTKEQLKRIVALHRWALEELTYDCFMIEANRICSSGRIVKRFGYKRMAEIEDRLYIKKEKEAVALFVSAKLMATYLLSQYGSMKVLVETLSAVIMLQKGHCRKTMHLRK
jgi:hypothetical protein